jgi:hypothetical protein
MRHDFQILMVGEGFGLRTATGIENHIRRPHHWYEAVTDDPLHFMQWNPLQCLQ